jgi:superfamily II DNA or RNA helicase
MTESSLPKDEIVTLEELKPNKILRGPLFPEPVQVLVATPMGAAVKLIGKGLNSSKVFELVLTTEKLALLQTSPDTEPFDGDSKMFRLGIEAMRLGLAFEYDPYFSLSIAKVDPLPHQLEAVYDYFMRLPRIRFLLADDPGAGKTIMAGLLIKELKIRGLVKRILIITPASLSFQWQREMKDKFRENFEIIRSDILRANYGSNPWQDKSQVITSVSWVSRIEDAKESLLRSHWDLIIVDEAHKMSAASRDKKTLAYQLGEALSGMTDHYLLMTATPHKGDAENFCLFLELLDRDVYGDVKSLEEAMKKHEAPFYLRRVKEALVTFPDPETGEVKTLFTKRKVQTIEFKISDQEWDFYDALTRYVEDQSIKAASQDDARGRALGFTMAMLQRRFASSTYAARRSLERMKEKREKILADPEGYRQSQINKRLPDEFDDLPDEERQEIIAELEDLVVSYDPATLKEEIFELGKLIDQARRLENAEVESKLVKVRELLTEHGIFKDPKMKLLIFTEHKDTLDFLVGDGKDGRPLGRLVEWGLATTQIHGSMKVGDRDTPGTRIYAEREFRESAQVLVATEAAGEGINLQFCWFMINYDVPWNFVRLEQRMGRIHRYGQEKNCLILNFISTNTREGRVMQVIFERAKRAEDDLDPHRTGKVFNVLGEIFPANQLEKMIRDMYAHNQMTEEIIKQRIVEEVNISRFEHITKCTLELLAKKELNLSAIIGKSAEAKERRLVPEVIEDFFVQAAPTCGIQPKETRDDSKIYRIGRVPRQLWPIGERLEPRFGKLGHEYKNIVFDKQLLPKDPTLEWVTPGHPLFEAVREDLLENAATDLQRGSIFYDLHTAAPYRLDFFAASVKDGRDNQIHRRLFAVQAQALPSPGGEGQPALRSASDAGGGEGGTPFSLQPSAFSLSIKQPTVLLDLAVAPKTAQAPASDGLPDRTAAEQFLVQTALNPMLAEVTTQRARETHTIARHIEISLNELINRQQVRLGELSEMQERGDTSQPLAANFKQTEDRIDELNARLEHRRAELERERECMIGDIQHVARAWVLPHPERQTPQIAAMVSDPEIERIAVQFAIKNEEAQGRVVESVEADNRGFDLISRKPHPEDPKTAIDVRFIEVKGRADTGDIALTSNEYNTAKRLKKDYYLYIVLHCASTPSLNAFQDPATLDWQPIVKVEHYRLMQDSIRHPVDLREDPGPYRTGGAA